MSFGFKALPLTSSLLMASLFIGQAALAQVSLKSEGSESTVTISAVGDIMIGTNFPTNRLPPEDGRRFFEDAESYIRAADIRFGNMEGVLYDGAPGAGSKGTCGKCYSFRTPTRFVRTFQRAGFNVMSLANNHSRDMGDVGLKSSMEALTGADIQYTGKHQGIGEFNVRGIRVAVIGADYYKGGRSVIEPERLLGEVRDLKTKFDIVVITAHVGAEGSGASKVTFGTEIFLGENRGNSFKFAHDAIDAGADLIIMSGPHVPRGMEVYKGRLIAYSLGNFATGNGINIGGIGGYAPLLRVQMNKRGEFRKGHVASFIQGRPDRVYFDKDQRAMKMMRQLSESQFKGNAPMFTAEGFIAPGNGGGAGAPMSVKP